MLLGRLKTIPIAVWALLWIVYGMAVPQAAAEDDSEHLRRVHFFETRIRPVLVKHCYECHSESNGDGELRLDERSRMLKGGSRGPAVVPTRPDASLLIDAIGHVGKDLQMPPKQDPLSESVIADFRKWIRDGAVFPSQDSVTLPKKQMPADHWAYQPLKQGAEAFAIQSPWARCFIDGAILKRLAEQGLKPSSDASPQTLVRRVYFDVIGLPPPPSVVKQFVRDCRSNGIDAELERLVDSLLESEQFGVRWGRHWLDVARYGESSGGESNISFPHAWRYRDYVFDAFNDDLPYDRFLIEQLAGDLLPNQSDRERARLLTATGFLALGTKNLGENNEEQFRVDMIDEQIDSMSRSILASSIACARCHHHKFDPFTMEDYYGLAGVFASTTTYFGTSTSPANIRSGDPLVLPRIPGQKIFHRSLSKEKFAELKAKHAELDETRRSIVASQRDRFAGKDPERVFTLRDVLANLWRLGGVEGKLETLDADGKALPLAMGVLDAEEIVDAPLLARGEIGRVGNPVPRGVPSVLKLKGLPPFPKNQSGRLELARWITHPNHPLTARVYVNRVWSHLFGQGIVSTVDDFGTTGARPSHLELLDSLSSQFVTEGWSTKRLIRTLILSRSYRQSSTYDANAFAKDPENQWLWRMPKRRLEAEAIRDAMLVASRELDKTRPEGSLVAKRIGDRPISLIGLNRSLPMDLDGAVHRSAYLPVIRDRLPNVLDLFDFAEPSLVTGVRDQTNVPVQALYLMNSAFVMKRSTAMAKWIRAESSDGRAMVTHGFEVCFSRAPDPAEMARSLSFLGSEEISNVDELTIQSFCQALLSTAEFRSLD